MGDFEAAITETDSFSCKNSEEKVSKIWHEIDADLIIREGIWTQNALLFDICNVEKIGVRSFLVPWLSKNWK